MTRSAFLSLLLLLLASTASAGWTKIAPGVEYQEFAEPGIDIHVARIDLTNPHIAVVASRESDRGTTVAAFAKRTNAIVAVNGDYFDESYRPVGLTIGPCGRWDARVASSKRKQGLFELGRNKARVASGSLIETEGAAKWAREAVSGWPTLVDSCMAQTSQQLPGSDSFTRAPHPRTAVGLSKDGKRLYLVVADGRRSGVPGLTLAELAAFFTDRLEACQALNLDGGGSTTMVLNGQVMNRPSDGVERAVGNHLAVVRREDMPACTNEAALKTDANARLNKPAPPVPASLDGIPRATGSQGAAANPTVPTPVTATQPATSTSPQGQ